MGSLATNKNLLSEYLLETSGLKGKKVEGEVEMSVELVLPAVLTAYSSAKQRCLQRHLKDRNFGRAKPRGGANQAVGFLLT
ncbi:hypothetical protein RUM43_000279 [Polyplax serrata]|uniref:Uncharacterized protein n=1 Tax=Polyplax serrata TaxID=468196 RepID=A0AAN8SDN8_POLSC